MWFQAWYLSWNWSFVTLSRFISDAIDSAIKNQEVIAAEQSCLCRAPLIWRNWKNLFLAFSVADILFQMGTISKYWWASSSSPSQSEFFTPIHIFKHSALTVRCVNPFLYISMSHLKYHIHFQVLFLAKGKSAKEPFRQLEKHFEV